MNCKIIKTFAVSGIAVASLLSSFCTSTVKAADSEDKPIGWFPIQLALTDPLQIVPKTWDIYGVRINIIYSENNNVGFADIGIVNRTAGNQAGFQVGAVINRVEKNVSGIQVGSIMNSCGKNSMVEGLQLGAVNTSGDVTGLQLGVFNRSETIEGLQLGVINSTNSLDGVQFGLINLNSGGPLKFMLLLNFGF
jgi:hypothetical protein